MPEIDEIIPYYKPLGYTPLEVIAELKAQRPELVNVPVTYAGRLDPMAEGLLLLLAGSAVYHKDEFNGLDKTYEAKILLDFQTDTGDILGIPKAGKSFPIFSKEEIQNVVATMSGSLNLPLPIYSSPPVNGKPLWQWARENRLNEIEIPTREMKVQSVIVENIVTVLWSNIYQNIINSLSLVHGNDFRQEEIIQHWARINSQTTPEQELQIISIKVDCASGTYIRSLAEELGRRLGCSALLYHLKRTRIGSYTVPF